MMIDSPRAPRRLPAALLRCELIVLVLAFACLLVQDARAELPKLTRTTLTSSLDNTDQPIAWWAPGSANSQPRPLLVLLHTWSADYRQDRYPWLEQAVQREWIYIQPNFRGRNDNPEACGSPLAQQDILDTIDWAIEKFEVDHSRIYLAGVSGGGHMSLLMAGRYPQRFSAVSSWVPPTDLAEWYHFHCRDGKPANYARMISSCCGGPPGTSDDCDRQYHDRSPIFHLANVGDLPLDINAGVFDGKTGSVPFTHSLKAYNTIAASHGSALITSDEMDQLWKDGRLSSPAAGDTAPDSLYGRDILLRRTSRNTRVTIFDGTHEALAAPACAWLAEQSRQTAAPTAASARAE